jgi:catechol 2,3-dioxygenase-like lactoylglutathione lyase family enzyme
LQDYYIYYKDGMNQELTIDPMVGSPLVRAALIVTDLDRSRDFYGSLLGFTEEFASGVTRDAAVAALLGQPPGSLCRFVVIKRPGPAFGMIGLFEASEPTPPAAPAPSAAIQRGNVFLVFYVKDFEPFLARLESLGGRLLVPPTLFSSKRGSQREIVACDPDGVRLNLLERDPLEAWRTEGPGRVF